jgi:hypothetical protein
MHLLATSWVTPGMHGFLCWGVSSVPFLSLCFKAKNLPIRGNICNCLCRRPWQYVAHSGANHLLTTSWMTPGTLRLFYFALGGEFCPFFISAF